MIKPGSLREMLMAMASGSFSASDVREQLQPAYVDREARLACMDEQGVEAILLFPTLAVCVEHFMKHDADLLYANFHAFNRWLDDDWGFDARGPDLRRAAAVARSTSTGRWPSSSSCSPRCPRRRAASRSRPTVARPPIRISTRSGPGSTKPRVPGGFHIGESGYNELLQP